MRPQRRDAPRETSGQPDLAPTRTTFTPCRIATPPRRHRGPKSRVSPSRRRFVDRTLSDAGAVCVRRSGAAFLGWSVRRRIAPRCGTWAIAGGRSPDKSACSVGTGRCRSERDLAQQPLCRCANSITVDSPLAPICNRPRSCSKRRHNTARPHSLSRHARRRPERPADAHRRIVKRAARSCWRSTISRRSA